MSTPSRPSVADLNMDRLVAETVPAQIRNEQQEIAALEKKLIERRFRLRRLLDTAVLYGIELFPQTVLGNGPAVHASDPGGTDTPPGLAGTDGVSPAARAA